MAPSTAPGKWPVVIGSTNVNNGASVTIFRWVRRALVLGLFWCIAAAPALAQIGSLKLQVLGSDGQPLPGATVVLTNTQQLITDQTLITDDKGQALFPVLRVGAGYRVEVRFPGFATQRRGDLRVRSNSVEPLTIQLGELVEERIEVVGESSPIEIGEVGSHSRFSSDFIETLPASGRFYQDILTLAPGVSDEDKDGNPNVHGSRTRDFRAEVGGVSNVDPLTGQWLSRINPDSIEELEIVPQGAGVEFGRAQGGFARILQKQGTNEFEGVFNFLFRTSKLDETGAADPLPEFAPDDFETVQPSIQLSGPLVKDRLWYRLSHEYIEEETPVNVLNNNVEVVTRKQSLNADQLTWQVSPRNKLSLQFQRDPLRVEGLGLASDTPLESTRTLERGGPTYSISWTAPQSARVLFESTVAFQDHEVDVIPTTPESAILEQRCLIFANLPGLQRARCENLTDRRISGRYFQSSLDERQRLTVKSQATIYQPWGNHSHRMKFGFIVENEQYKRELDRRPDVSFEWRDTGFSLVGLATTRIALPRVSEAIADGTNWAFYFEDQWKPHNSLALTIGLRVDREEIDSLGRQQIAPTEESEAYLDLIAATGIPVQDLRDIDLENLAGEAFTAHEDIRLLRDQAADAVGVNAAIVRLSDVMSKSRRWIQPRLQDDISIHNTNFSPRFALAWDPWSNGKTKISLSAGRYFDKIFLAVPLVELEPVETSITYDAFALPLGSPVRFQTNANDVTITPLTARMVDRELKTPYQDEWSAGFERELFNETALKLTYVKRKFRDQLQDVDINNAPGDFGYCERVGFFGDEIIVTPSPGVGQLLFDPFAFESYRDDDPGLGDGRLDDCFGQVNQGSFFLGFGPDGLPDLYLKNPAWRELLLLGNFNAADYEAFVVEVVRRQYRNWQLNGSYTWSIARGDAEDFDLLLGNELNRRDDEAGFLSYDQRHVVKLNLATHTPWNFDFGAVMRWESGLPFSIVKSALVSHNIPNIFPYEVVFAGLPRFRFPSGRRNDQRNPSFWTLDLRLTRDFPIGRTNLLQLSVEAFNVFNDDTLRLESRTDNRLVGSRRFGRRWQVGMKLAF